MALFIVAIGIGMFMMLRDVTRTAKSNWEPTHVTKYDSITEATIDSISISRQTAHRRIDDLHDDLLQSALDSAFNK